MISWLTSWTLQATQDACNDTTKTESWDQDQDNTYIESRSHPKVGVWNDLKLHFHMWNNSFKLGHVEEEAQLMTEQVLSFYYWNT